MLERKNTRAYNMIFDGVETDFSEKIGKAYWTGTCISMFHSYWRPTGTASEVGSGDFGVRPVVILKPEITTDAVQKIQDKKEEEWNYIPSFE